MASDVIITNVIDPASGGVLAVDTSLGDGMVYPLTTCCNASGKGGGWGVICRSCYEDVDYAFGMAWMLPDLPTDLAEPIQSAIAAAGK